MNRRIIKKLSERIAEILPDRYAHAFIDDDSDSDTYGMLCIGGNYVHGVVTMMTLSAYFKASNIGYLGNMPTS